MMQHEKHPKWHISRYPEITQIHKSIMKVCSFHGLHPKIHLKTLKQAYFGVKTTQNRGIWGYPQNTSKI